MRAYKQGKTVCLNFRIEVSGEGYTELGILPESLRPPCYMVSTAQITGGDYGAFVDVNTNGKVSYGSNYQEGTLYAVLTYALL